MPHPARFVAPIVCVLGSFLYTFSVFAYILYSILWYLILCLAILSLSLSFAHSHSISKSNANMYTSHHRAQHIFMFISLCCISFCFVSNAEFRLHSTPPPPHISFVRSFGRTNVPNSACRSRSKVVSLKSYIAIDAVAHAEQKSV